MLPSQTHQTHQPHVFIGENRIRISPPRAWVRGASLWWSDQQWKPFMSLVKRLSQADGRRWVSNGIRTCRDLLTLFFPYAPACNRTWDVSMTSGTSTEFASSGRSDLQLATCHCFHVDHACPWSAFILYMYNYIYNYQLSQNCWKSYLPQKKKHFFGFLAILRVDGEILASVLISRNSSFLHRVFVPQ